MIDHQLNIFKNASFSAEQQQLLKEKTKLTFTINDLMEEVRGDNDSRKRAEEELDKLKSQIAAKEAELENIKPQVRISCVN